LMTYGWVLILVATAVGVLVFLMGSPSDIVFSSDSPNKILLKAGIVEANVADAILQNITGGAIEVTGLTVVEGSYSNCQVNEQVPSQGTPVSIIAGGTFELTCDLAGEDPTGAITVSYSDFANLPQTATVRISSGASGSGGSSPPTEILLCGETVDEAGSYTIPSGGLNETSGGTCITITADDVILDCGGPANPIVGDGQINGKGIKLDGVSNVTVRNCALNGFSAGGGYAIISSGSNNTITGNILQNNSSGISSYGAGNTISGNTVQGGEVAIGVTFSTDVDISNNTISESSFLAIRVMGSIGYIIDGTVSSNNITTSGSGRGIWLSTTTVTVNDNTICGPNYSIDCDGVVGETIVSGSGNVLQTLFDRSDPSPPPDGPQVCDGIVYSPCP